MTGPKVLGTWLALGAFVLTNAALVSGCYQTDVLWMRFTLMAVLCLLWAVVAFTAAQQS